MLALQATDNIAFSEGFPLMWEKEIKEATSFDVTTGHAQVLKAPTLILERTLDIPLISAHH